MPTVLGEDELVATDALLATLAAWVANPPFAVPLHVVTFVRVANWRSLSLPEPQSAYARALFRLANGDEDLEQILAPLDPATSATLEKDAVTFTRASLAPALADAAAARKLIPGPRLASQLARVDLPRCMALLARLEQTVDGRIPHIESTVAAYLSARANGSVPAELRTAWRALAEGPTRPYDHALRAARVEVLAVDDVASVLPALVEGFEEHGASGFANVTPLVIPAAMRHDRAGVIVLANEGWPQARATVLEGIANGEPSAPELPILFDEILAEWRDGGPRIDRTPSGTVELLFPLLRSALATRDYERARRAVSVLQPSTFMLAAATWRSMRVTNLADGVWRSSVWDELAAASTSGDEAIAPAMSATEAAAAWKLETLPLADLPWFDARRP